MISVNSRPTLRLLTRRFLKLNRGRNLIAVLAIVMTAVMFTSAFTGVLSVLRSTMNQDMRTSMDSSHLAIQDLTKEQFEQIRDYEKIDRMGYTVFMSTAENAKLRDSGTEIRYADKNGASSYQCLPTVGELPKKENEVAMSTITLDLLGVPRQIGSRVTLEFMLSGQKVTQTFSLSGYWEGDTLAQAQMVWVSEQYCLKHVKTATEKAIALGDYEGDYNLSLWFRTPLFLEHYKEEIDQRYGVSDTQARMDIPPAYDKLFGEDGFPVGTMLLILAVIFLAGYLIIYNVFYISVKNDIQSYGLLKNAGTTGRQLRWIVRRQALTLAAVGIPIGLLAGWFVGRGMTPYLLTSELGSEKPQVLISTNPWIFLGAALFSLGTVYTASLRPCKMAAKISPVEAVKLEEPSVKGKHKKTGKVTPVRMALGNMRRMWRKSVLVILSLTLPIFLLNCAYVVRESFDFDLYIDSFISSDFCVTGCFMNAKYSDFHGITPQFLKELEKREEVESVACVYETESMHDLDDTGYENLRGLMRKAKEKNIIDGYQMEQEQKFLENRQVISHVLGISQGAFEKMEFLGEGCTWEEFQSGDYVIVNRQRDVPGNYYHPGDTVTVELGEGQEGTYTVLAVGELAYDLDYPFGAGTYFDYSFYLPAQEYLKLGGDSGAMTVGIEVRDGTQKVFDRWLKAYIEDDSSTELYVQSRMSIEKECEQFAGKYVLVLGLLCGVIFVIGVLNFFNTSAVSILTRKKELSLLEAVGMTKKQLRRMLMAEGSFYFFVSLLIADTVGLALMRVVLMRTVGRSFFFVYTPSVTASLAAVPPLLLIAFGVPLYNYRKMCRETIVERIRQE